MCDVQHGNCIITPNMNIMHGIRSLSLSLSLRLPVNQINNATIHLTKPIIVIQSKMYNCARKAEKFAKAEMQKCHFPYVM